MRISRNENNIALTSLRKRTQALDPANDDIADMIDEIAHYLSISPGDQYFKVLAFKKAALAVRTLDFPVVSGAALMKGASKVRGIGPAYVIFVEVFSHFAW